MTSTDAPWKDPLSSLVIAAIVAMHKFLEIAASTSPSSFPAEVESSERHWLAQHPSFLSAVLLLPDPQGTFL
jgi:hypothetical protein